MTQQSFLADKLRSGTPVITAWTLLSAPMVPELLARAGYEAVTLDVQHGMFDFETTVESLAAIALGGAHRIARIPVGDNALAGRFVDMGAECIIAPMINSKKEAEEFARAIKYPPVGERSWSPFRAAMLSGQTSDQYLKNANSQTLSLAMIETQDAIDALDDILSVPELDGVFVGPSDLSLSLSKGTALDPNGVGTATICADIARRTRAAGKIAGIFCLNAEKVEEGINQGFQLLSHGIDTIFLDHAARAALKEVEAVVASPKTPGVSY
ncbi:MAG: hydroxyacid aldolase [Roseibium sp.]|uniref:HpcH/HpaI aldolase family protein n=1 Tax=Roseibium sp. TaxID=1936156 RepID=UPI0026171FFC|nr:aldolase/citrate lyase family protein [Roseibium sp.]MCV0429701.1 hydroxyacid aldolase [Roseibium sp.]